MKLRRAMAAAAATAVIAPVALLAAPAAYATDETTPTPSASVSESAPETSPSPSETETTPETSPSPSVSVSESAPEATASASASASTSASPSTSASTTPSEPADGDDEEYPECEEANISVGLTGFPEKIVAGSGWKTFEFNVKNTSKTDIESLQVTATAFSAADLDSDEDQLFDKYAHFEYRNPSTGKWTNDFADTGINNGFFFGEFPLDAGQKVTIDLRVKIDAGAPVGDSLAIAAGGYDTSDGDCFQNGAVYPFQILKAGSKPGDVDDAKPSGQKPPKDIKPQGEAKPIEVEGNLAETGSSSALPMISLVGGAAVVAGAGAIFVVRRRKAGAEA
ncbi:LAETG motif-containing sortase-dependent surface protein [Streptomyces dubilierae]|uniref:LAETG motif-containing sortase-dependent surface protein n=1 Tax=Streptomyces dubilierae TaxID=3075533 RepID=A0ABU2P6J5_9ACTN|nr:LAETG motif-containing sortase-dependent surface protein [Streptomyces sp. DSM 41921]MDT0387393.1 LAETG motif-containing sortase-dependent surface protein [Streptomyces sp. DSM 41921]